VKVDHLTAEWYPQCGQLCVGLSGGGRKGPCFFKQLQHDLQNRHTGFRQVPWPSSERQVCVPAAVLDSTPSRPSSVTVEGSPFTYQPLSANAFCLLLLLLLLLLLPQVPTP
jgi:hypothetical protein